MLGETFDPLRERVPYLHADPALVAVWRERLAKVPHPRIGIVWSGNPRHTNDHKRSIARSVLEPLVKLAGAHLVSMQIGATDDPQIGAFDAAPFMTDFADSAALLSELDLLITIDSGPAHLAGALGVPVWTLLPFNPDWRWLLGREDTLWYPTMRLFRQPKPGAWGDVLVDVCKETKKFLAGDKAVLQPKPWVGEALTRHPQALLLPGIETEPDY